MCNKEAELLAKVERVRSNCRKAIRLLQPWIALNGGPSNNPFNEGKQAGIALALDYLREEFPDAKEWRLTRENHKPS